MISLHKTCCSFSHPRPAPPPRCLEGCVQVEGVFPQQPPRIPWEGWGTLGKILPPKLTYPLKNAGWKTTSFQNGPFLGDMLIFRGVSEITTSPLRILIAVDERYPPEFRWRCYHIIIILRAQILVEKFPGCSMYLFNMCLHLSP